MVSLIIAPRHTHTHTHTPNKLHPTACALACEKSGRPHKSVVAVVAAACHRLYTSLLEFTCWIAPTG